MHQTLSNLVQSAYGSTKGLARNIYFTGALAAFGALALGGCTAANAQSFYKPDGTLNPQALNSSVNIITHYNDHLGIAGIDMQKGEGHPIVGVEGLVHSAGVTPEGGNRIIVENELGYQILYSCNTENFVQPGQKVDEKTMIATEGYRCGSVVSGRSFISHLHLSVFMPRWAELFGMGDKFEYNGVTYLNTDPNKFAKTGDVNTSLYSGKSNIADFVKQADEKFNAIGEKYKNTFLGFFINQSKGMKDIRTPTRWLVAYNFLRQSLERGEGSYAAGLPFQRSSEDRPYLKDDKGNFVLQKDAVLIKDSNLVKDMADFFKFHLTLTGWLTSPYALPNTGINYQKLPEDPGRMERLDAIGEKLRRATIDVKLEEALELNTQLKTLAPIGMFRIGGEAWLNRSEGILLSRLKRDKESIAYLLAADALALREHIFPHQLGYYREGIYRRISLSLQKLGLHEEKDYYGLQHKKFEKHRHDWKKWWQ